MVSMANQRRPGPGKRARHLVAVPDDAQPPLWDTAELKRLAALRRLAVATDQPTEAVLMIDGASTADDALDSLVAAGLMPGVDRSVDGVLSWFAPLLEPGCDQLTAELAGSQFVAEMRRWSPPGADVVTPLLALVENVAGDRRGEAFAMLRALGAVSPPAVRAAASAAANRMTAAGAADMPWASGLGAPKPRRCFGYEDIYGEQLSLVLPFAYGRHHHAIVVVIDFVAGGGLKDVFVCDYSEQLRAQYRAAGQDPEVRYRDYTGVAARTVITEALARPVCPAESAQAEHVADYLELLRARVTLLPATSAARPEPNTSAARTRSPRNIHRIKVTLRGSKPPVWRRFEVPSDISLRRLHGVIQAGFGWQDLHLHVFDTTAGQFGIRDPDEPDVRSDASRRLSSVADWPGDHFEYEYDFGDSWRHVVSVEAVHPAEPGVAYPRCTAGKRACPPEDCGGISGYNRMLRVLSDPHHEDHQARLTWLGVSSAAEFDPERFDPDVVNDRLSGTARVLARA